MRCQHHRDSVVEQYIPAQSVAMRIDDELPLYLSVVINLEEHSGSVRFCQICQLYVTLLVDQTSGV